MTWSKHWAPTRGSPRARSRASAPTWTPRSPRSGIGPWPTNGSRMCSSTPPTARPGSITGVSQAVVIATGVAADGRREVLGFDVGDSEDGAFWTAFLRSLKSRGLSGVQLVISDAHTGLRDAIEAILIGAAWQRCRVQSAQHARPGPEGIRGDGRQRSAPSSPTPVREQRDTIAGMLGRQLPKVETMLRGAADDITAFADFPVPHCKKIWSTNPLERLNKRSSVAPTSSACSPTRPPCSGSRDQFSSRHTTNGRSPTNAISPKPPWPCSTAPMTNPTNTLRSQPH